MDQVQAESRERCRTTTPRAGQPREPALRQCYAAAGLAMIPRLLGAIDRNPYRPTYGCLDRQFWHYRTSGFASEMYQEGVLPLALVYATPLPGNRWYGNRRVAELAEAALRFSAGSGHGDGSCDDYYPYERALGAAVFSLQAGGRACQLLRVDDREIVEGLRRRARWIMEHDESGRLANHQALAALGLLRVAELTGEGCFADAARRRVERVLQWQSAEGWFEEYGGADPGYQTVTIDCLAKYQRATGAAWLEEPLRRAVAFCRWFLHPDDSFGGEYGSRGTYHFYPHGFELLAAGDPNAADLADGFLRSLARGSQACFDDDRLVAHRGASLIEAWLDWSPHRAAGARTTVRGTRYFRGAGLLVSRDGDRATIVSTARGGVFKHFAAAAPPVTDAGLIVETADGRVAVSQMHELSRAVESVETGGEGDVAEGSGRWQVARLSVGGPLHWAAFETATPLKQALFHVGMVAAGRWCRRLVRRMLQRRLITGRAACPVRLTRVFEFGAGDDGGPRPLRVSDTIELVGRRVRVRRMAFGVDHQAAYVAASGVYQDGVLAPWTDLSAYVDELNASRRVTVVRSW